MKILLLVAVLLLVPAVSSAQAPVLFFSDLDSGPNNGGETVGAFAGGYVTVYGNFLGAAQGTSSITWNGLSCLRVVSWSTPWLWYQKIVVQLGPSCTAGTGNFVVSVGGASSNGLPFTVRAGNIYCVNISTGNNANNGHFPSSCWKDAWFAKNSLANGDIAYLRAGTWSGIDPTGPDNDTVDLSGRNGASGNPKALVGYPGETATIACTGNTAECIDIGAKSGSSTWWTIAELDLAAGGTFAHYIIDLENSNARDGMRWVGNKIHGAKAVNVVYQGLFTSSDFLGNDDYNYWSVPNGASNAERGYGLYYGGYGTQQNINVQYNRFANDQGTGGISTKGLQIYAHCPADCGGINDFFKNVTIANNLFTDNCMEGIAANGTDGGTQPWVGSGTTKIYNNVISGNGSCNTIKNFTYSGIQTGDPGQTLQIYDNSFYLNAGGSIGNQNAGDIDITGDATTTVTLSNNTFYAQPTGQFYTNFIVNTPAAVVKSGANNVFFSNGNANAVPPSWVTGTLTGNPLYVNAGTKDFHLAIGSPAIATGTVSLLPPSDITGLVRLGAPSIGAYEPALMGPLVQSSNTNYFKTPTGKTIVLVGSQTWNTVQDTDTSNSTTTWQALDYPAYINNLVAWGHNATILWHKDLPNYCGWTGGGGLHWSMGPWQWVRSSTPGAADGGNKFDLNTFNQAFFDRVRARAILARQYNIYVVVELFDGLGLAANRCTAASDGYPLSGVNNINGVSDDSGVNSMTMGAPNAITAIQEAYLKKMVDTLNDLPNVIWEPSEEAPVGSRAWWNPFMIDMFHRYEAGGTLTQTGETFTAKPFKHPVLYATIQTNNSLDSDLYNSSADAVAPAGQTSPTSSCGSGTPTCKVNINDSDHSYSLWTDTQLNNRKYIWTNTTNGNGVMFMDPYVIFNSNSNRNICANPVNAVCPLPITTAGSYQMNMRLNMGYAAQFLNGKMNLTSSTVQHSLCSTGQCLATNTATNFEFLVYDPSTSSFTVNLSAQNGKAMHVQWLDPVSGTITTAVDYTATSSTSQSFTPPNTLTSDAVLYLVDINGGPGAATAGLNPTSLSFGNQTINTTSSAQSVTLTNTGSSTVTITNISLAGTNSGDFAISGNTCGASLAPNSSCAVSVTFRPTALASRSANLAFTTSPLTSPDNAALSGTGVASGSPAANFTPASLAFGSVKVPQSAGPTLVTLKNTGSAVMNISSISLTGTNASEFSQTNTCSATLAVNATCAINVTFTPTSAGNKAANISVVSDTGTSPDAAPLTGTGTTPVVSLSSTNINFLNQFISTTSLTQVVVMTNTGTASLVISSVLAAGDFAQANNCGASLGAGSSCNISITFTPTILGPRSGSVTVTDDAAGSPHLIALSGTGVKQISGIGTVSGIGIFKSP